MVTQVATSFFDKDVPDVALRSLFQKYDKDQSGYLSRDQIREFLENDLGLTKEQAEAYALMIDQDANKAISYEELVKWLRSGEKFKHINDKTKCYRLIQAVKYFKRVDTDQNGTIDPEEFSQLMLSLNYPKEHIPGALKHLDLDGDNKVSFPEFLKWLNWIEEA